MDAEYKEILQFMDAYCHDYDTLAQEADTVDVLDKYCTTDFVSIAYMAMPGQAYPFRVAGLENWKNFLVEGHKHVVEDFHAESIFIDPIQWYAVARLRIQKFDKISGKKLMDADGMGCYQLTKVNGEWRMVSLQFFCGDTSKFAGLYNHNSERS